MTPAKSMPRFQCEYCKHRTTRAPMVKHERNCYWNPNRVCDTCSNTGEIVTHTYPDGYQDTEECPYCAKCKAAHESARKAISEGVESETFDRWARAVKVQTEGER